MTDTAAIHKRLADAYAELSEIHAELAGRVVIDVVPLPSNATPADVERVRAQLRPLETARPNVHVPPEPDPRYGTGVGPQSSPVLDVNVATHCPKHGTEYRHGNYGPFCPNVTDDPAFADRKGYCNLPGKDAQRALAWIAIQQRAAR